MRMSSAKKKIVSATLTIRRKYVLQPCNKRYFWSGGGVAAAEGEEEENKRKHAESIV